MDDTDALELTGLEVFVHALLDGGLVIPDDPGGAADDTGTGGSRAS